MISRYEIPEMSNIWNEDNKFQTYLKIEIALLKSLEAHKIIPINTHQSFINLKINPTRIQEIEKRTGHDVIAFTESITEQVENSAKKFFHFGCTSSDIIDTAHSLLIADSLKLITKEIDLLLETLKKKAQDYKDVICLGRSHGIYAEPMSFGSKFLLTYSEIKQDLKLIKNWTPTGMCSGAVGNYTVLSREVEKKFCEILQLKVEPVTTQIIGRRKFAELVQMTTLLASDLERFAIELRHLQHSDINEAQEGFSQDQKGSSTMPHKKNPISAENISGLCRLLRSHMNIAQENILLWHERDISHSSNERLYLPDHFGILLYVIKRMNTLVKNLNVNVDHVENKVFNQFSVLSSYVLHQLILEKDLSRETLYKIVQQASFESQNLNEFLTSINQKANTNIKINKDDFKRIFLKYTDDLYKEVF